MPVIGFLHGMGIGATLKAVSRHCAAHVLRFARLCKLDNAFGDSFIDKIALVAKLKSCASHFVCDVHDPLGLGIEFGTV